MAIVKCKECKSEISSKADVCPRCGVRRRAKNGGCIVAFGRLIGGLIGAAVGILVVIYFMTHGR